MKTHMGRLFSMAGTFLLVAAMAACSSSGGGGGGGGSNDTTPTTATCAPITSSAGGGVITASRANRSGPKPLLANAFNVVQTIPPSSATGVDPNSPVILFFSDLVNQSTVTNSTVPMTGSVSGAKTTTASFSTSTSGNSVVSLSSTTPFSACDNVTVSWNGVANSAGDTVTAGTATFQVGAASSTATNFGAGPVIFQSAALPAGVTCSGDCGVLGGNFGDAAPVYNNYSAYFSSGDSVGAGSAGDYTTSTLTVHGLTSGGSTLSFSYRFISAEFPDYIDSEFDDVFVVTVSGPSGSKTQTINSVNTLGANLGNLTAGTFPANGAVNVSGSGDAMMSAVLTGSVSVSTLGTPLTVNFSASDVGDSAYDTVVQLNNVRIQ